MKNGKLPSSKKDAIAVNSNVYFTGVPCKYGHLSARYTNDGKCSKCVQIRTKEYRQKNKEHYIEYDRKYREENKEKIAAYKQEYAIENKERLAINNKIYRENNADRIGDQRRGYRLKNKEEKSRKDKEYVEKNKDKVKMRKRKWYEENRDKVARKQVEYCKNNKDKVNFLSMKRHATKINAKPSWSKMEIIKLIYRDARVLSDMFGEVFHVDHIVPLRGESVCGLHVEHNLQILPRSNNASKSNELDDVLAASDCHWVPAEYQ